MKTKYFLGLISAGIVIFLLCGCSSAPIPNAESAENAESDTKTSVIAPVEAEYSVKAFDVIDSDTVKSIAVAHCYNKEKHLITDPKEISEIIDMVNGISLSYTGMTSKGSYDARVTLSFLNEYGNKAYSHITLHSGKRCEYKVNSRDSYFNIYDMENGDALFDTVMAYVNEE